MLTIEQKNNINRFLGFPLTDTQFDSLERSKMYFFRDKTEYKIQIMFKIPVENIISILKSKNFKIKELDVMYGLHDIIIIYQAPTPALYHVDRTLYRWNWSVYDLNLKVCLYHTNNKESPDITSKLFA